MSQRRRQARGWAAHAGLRLRSERAWLLVLPAAVLVLTAILCPSYATTYSSQAAMARAVASARANDTVLLLYGRLASGADPVQIAVWELGAMTCLGLGVVVVLHAAAIARGEEDQGRAEILHSVSMAPARRVLGQALVLALLSALIGIGAGTGLLALDGASPADARAYGAAVGLTCLVLAALTHLAAQLASDRTAARGLGLAILATAFLAYGLSCSRDWEWAELAGGASPFALREALAPGGGDHWPPALWAGCAWVILVVVTALAAGRRDLGQGLMTIRAPWAGRPLEVSGPVPLALRLCLGSIIVWALAQAAAGWLLIDMGSPLVRRAQEGAFSANSAMGAILSRGDGPAEAYVGYAGSLIGALAALQAVGLASRAGAEELAGLAEALVATGIRPVRLLLAWWLAAVAASGLALCCAAGAAALIGHDALGLSKGDAIRLVAGQWPSAIAVASVASLICALGPRWRGASWLPPLICVGLIQFQGTLDVPERLRDANPLAQAGRTGSWWLLAASAAMLVIAVASVRRRDLALAAPSHRRRRHRHEPQAPIPLHREEEQPWTH